MTMSACETILESLNEKHEINKDQWILYIQKTMILAKNFKEFEKLEENALEAYKTKFLK